MRKFTILMIMVLLCLPAWAQNKPSENSKASKRFFVGLSYSYMNIDSKLTDLSLHSIWNGQDLGSQDLDQEEISEINSYVTRNNQLNSVALDFGMKILDKPGIKWKVEGALMVGLAKFCSKVENTTTGTNEYSFKSDFTKPEFGIGFTVGYQLTPHWGFSLRPLFASAFGKITNIEDQINLVPANVTQSGEDKFYSFYERVGLTADFTAGPVTISAGPGFYWFNSKHKYTLTRINNLNGEIYMDEITTWTKPRNFFDGNINITWRIIEPLTFYAMAGIGNDLIINSGIHFNF